MARGGRVAGTRCGLQGMREASVGSGRDVKKAPLPSLEGRKEQTPARDRGDAGDGPEGAVAYRNGGSSKARSLRECSRDP